MKLRWEHHRSVTRNACEDGEPRIVLIRVSVDPFKQHEWVYESIDGSDRGVVYEEDLFDLYRRHIKSDGYVSTGWRYAP